MTRKPKKITADSMHAATNKGVQCPQCGCHDTRVTRTTRLASASAVRRERTCRACRHVFATTERAIDRSS